MEKVASVQFLYCTQLVVCQYVPCSPVTIKIVPDDLFSYGVTYIALAEQSNLASWLITYLLFGNELILLSYRTPTILTEISCFFSVPGSKCWVTLR